MSRAQSLLKHIKIPPESEMIKMFEPWRSTSRNLNPIIISLTHFLAKKKCTYDEVDWILESLQYWIKHLRNKNEYATYLDYQNDNKTACMDNVIITPMGLVDDNLNPILKDGTQFV